jgi:hypothetical protein
MAIVTFEGQAHPLSLADLREVLRSAWPEQVADVHQFLYDTLTQPSHPQAIATVAVLRRVFGLLTPEAESGVFRPRWADAAHSELLIDLEKRATTKGALFLSLLAEPDSIQPAYAIACALTWYERQHPLTFTDLLRLQPVLRRVVEEARADLDATQAIVERLTHGAGEAGLYLPLGF